MIFLYTLQQTIALGYRDTTDLYYHLSIATVLFDLQMLLIFSSCQNRFSNQLTQDVSQSVASITQWSPILDQSEAEASLFLTASSSLQVMLR